VRYFAEKFCRKIGPGRALPLGDQVQHVLALRSEPDISACCAGQRNLQLGEHGEHGNRVFDFEQARVEIDVGGKGRYADERGDPDQEQRSHCLVEEPLIDVGGLLEDDHVAPRAFRCACTHGRTSETGGRHPTRVRACMLFSFCYEEIQRIFNKSIYICAGVSILCHI